MKTLNQIQGEVSLETWDSLVEHFAMQKQQCETEKAAALAETATHRADAIAAMQALAAKDAQLADQAAEAEVARQAATTAQAAAVEAAKLAIQTNLDALVTAAEAAHASGDLESIGAVIAQARSYTTAARRAKLESELAAAQAAAAAHAAALAALA
jgi:hypothetical protein